jgi:predicted  nucleic acid-binding Zn ribbon protein
MSDPCRCEDDRVLVLAISLSRDELPCGKCGGTVELDKVKGPREAVHLLRRWVDQAYAIEMLWFASGEYEDWAKGELDSGKSKVNQLGRQVAQKLNAAIPTWLYSAPHAGARVAVDKYLHHCPSCHEPTEETGMISKYGLGCKKCRVAGSAE